MWRGRTLRMLWLVLIAVCLSGCDFIKDSSARPWHPYALNKLKNQGEWWFTSFETYRDCVEATRHEVSTEFSSKQYSEPVGCGYSGK